MQAGRGVVACDSGEHAWGEGWRGAARLLPVLIGGLRPATAAGQGPPLAPHGPGAGAARNTPGSVLSHHL